MGIYDREYYRSEGPSYLDALVPEGRVCKWLIGITVVVFVAQIMTRAGQNFLGPVTGALILDPDAVLDGQVWRLLTYAFLHDPSYPWHIIVNMLCLWWFGSDIEQHYGSREFLALYLVSALLGGVAFQLWAMAQGGLQYCLGASGAITAVLVLTACHFPTRVILVMFLLPVPIWLFVVFQVGHDAYYFLSRQATRVAVVVHLAGAAFAFAYYKLNWRLLGWLPELRRRLSRAHRPNLRVYRPEEKEPVAVAAAKTPLEMDEHLEAKLDAVLEKVGKSGEESLNEAERRILLRASEIYKRKRT
jgi:membrane associated rhomboid family serine protease